jgi:hypothetical protein
MEKHSQNQDILYHKDPQLKHWAERLHVDFSLHKG